MRRIGVVVVLAVFVLAACGGGGGSKSSSVASGATATTAKATATTTKSSGSGGGISFSGSFCNDSNAATANASALDPGSGAAGFQKALDALKKFESEAPSEIKGDIKTIVDAYSQIVGAMTTAGTDPTKLQAAIAPLESEQAALTTASQHIDAYVTSHCK